MKEKKSEKELLSDYITNIFAIEGSDLQRIRERSQEMDLPPMRIKAEEGRFLQLLVRICGAERALEIGTLAGYSAIWILRGMSERGRLITLEMDPQHAKISQHHFKELQVADRVEIIVGDAHTSLDDLSKDTPFDFIFIDAEKPGYPDYFDWSLENLKIGGVITAHNVLRRGRVAGIGDPDAYTEGIKLFNKKVAQESRILSTIYPAGDGILIAVKVA